MDDNRWTFEDCLNYFDFSYEKDVDGYAFIDCQGAYLGNIGIERYHDPVDMISRLVDGVYGSDYLFDDDILEAYNCETIEEYVDRYGNDKEHEDGILYYCLHPEELANLPETLDINDLVQNLKDNHELY